VPELRLRHLAAHVQHTRSIIGEHLPRQLRRTPTWREGAEQIDRIRTFARARFHDVHHGAGSTAPIAERATEEEGLAGHGRAGPKRIRACTSAPSGRTEVSAPDPPRS
jgi:hypothetical protein